MKFLRTALPIYATAILCLFLLWGSQLNHDTSWYLISTKWWLHGIPIYEEISELNPPLAFYLAMPPVFLADVSGLDATLAMQIYVIIIALIALLWARMILISSGEYTADEVTCLTLTASIALMILPLANFAQREHQMLLFTWPYIAMSLTTVPKHFQRQAVFVGLFATLGLALKPYFLLIPLFITLTQIARARSIRPLFSTQNLTILGFCILYVLAARILHPAYFSKIIPQALLVYGAYNSGFRILISHIDILLILGLPIGFFAVYYHKKGSPVSAIFISITLAGLASYFIQSKGWIYHTLPILTYLTLLCGWVVFVIYVHFKNHRIAMIIAIAPISLLLVPALVNGPYSRVIYPEFAKYFTCPKGQRSFQMFSANVWPSYPMANYADAIPANRAPGLWRFPGAVRQLAATEDPKTRARLEAYMSEARKDVINDFMRVEPQLVIVDNNRFKPYFGRAEFSYIGYFSQVPEFRTRWEKYSQVGDFFGFDIYQREGCEIPQEVPPI